MGPDLWIIARRQDRCEVAGTPRLRFKRRPIADEELKRATFHARSNEGSRLIVVDSGRTQMVIATELARQESHPAWVVRLGRYELTNPIETDIEAFKIPDVVLGRGDGVYYVEDVGKAGNARNALSIVSESAAILPGVGRGRGETVIALSDIFSQGQT